MSTGYLYDERFLSHDTGEKLVALPLGGELEPVEHSSAARITRRSHALIAGSGLLEHLTPLQARFATIDDLALYHTHEHIEHVRAVCASGAGEAGDETGESTPVVAASWDAALLAAGSAMAAADAVIQGTVNNAYVLLRPPGHHATATASMGFCLFNNIVIAARHVRRTHNLRRIMIVDWDVHHGNGTESAFYGDAETLFVSLHQEDWYPLGRGKVTDVGQGDAAGRTVNIPLPAGTGDVGYLEAFQRVIGPIGRQFGPQIIFISAGQDPNMMDPLGRMMVTMEGFRRLAAFMVNLAASCCDGRLVALQEGGYSAEYVPLCTLAAIEGLAGRRSAVKDTHEGASELDRSRHEYRRQQSLAIDDVIAVQKAYWDL